ncbi:MAG: DUF6115 domain-containing protein [Clostridium sp.]|uniref:DUF6115 domain-containing protein n=1 Tax=Butyribacter sp. TaxID=2822465 RepID=UPI002A9D74C1|nr:DUF6115 domain-containing protein [Clostridium sp.]MDY5181345.1 DUF6115 domain-containing protein [Butyribacter sp.]
MIVIEIIMILIGLGAVIASFRLSNDNKKNDGVKAEIDSEQIDEKIREAVKKTEEEILNKADEKFSQISNDKIMGFNEYSNEIFDKIEKNHEETVFLYNMLTEKEKEIQNLIHSVDTTNADLRDEIAKAYQKVKKQLSDVDSALKQMEVENVKDDTIKSLKAEEITTLSENGKENVFENDEVSMSEKNTVLDEEEAKAIAEITNEAYISHTQDDNIFEENNKSENKLNSNSEIIALYKKGRNVLEISKMLSIGQGEVKLVIDLYNVR